MLVRNTLPPSTMSTRSGRVDNLGIGPAQGLVWALACGLLIACAQVIVKSHSLKYPAALIVAAAALSILLVVRHKYTLAIFSAGFILPFFVQYILVERDNQA